MANTEPMTIPDIDLDDVTGGTAGNSGKGASTANPTDDFVRQIQQHLAQPPSSALGGSQPQVTPSAAPIKRS